MTLTAKEREILVFLIRNCATTQRQIADALGCSTSNVSQIIGRLSSRDLLYWIPEPEGKQKRYVVSKQGLGSLSEFKVSDSDKLAMHAIKRAESILRDPEQWNKAPSFVGEPGSFDAESTIHAAATMDTSLRVIRWSKMFETLVTATSTSGTMAQTLKKKQLKLISEARQNGWLGSIGLRNFDWTAVATDHDSDAVYGSGGILEQLTQNGFVDAYPVTAVKTNGDPIYLEIYITTQRSSLGFQSMIMNVSSRVVALKAANASREHYCYLNHELRQPAQAIELISGQLKVLASKQQSVDASLANRLSALAVTTGKLSDRLDWTLKAFPARTNSKAEDTPVLQQVLAAASDIQRTFKSAKEQFNFAQDFSGVDQSKLTVHLVPFLFYHSVRIILRNCVQHGRSKLGSSISYSVDHIDSEKQKFITIRFQDHGKGMQPDILAKHQELANGEGKADASDIDRIAGLRMAILSFNGMGGRVSLRQTDTAKKETGLTIDVSLPVKEIQIHENSDSQRDSS